MVIINNIDMKKNYWFFLVLVLPFFLACSKDQVRILGNWTKGISPEAVERSGAVSFVIGDYAYVGLGIDKDGKELKDFWRYSKSGVWSKVEDFPGDPRLGAVAFVLEGKAYVGCGVKVETYRDEAVYYNDFYKYTPGAKTPWVKIESLPGNARRDAVAFTVKGKSYVGTGQDADMRKLKDFYGFDGSNWKKIEGFPGDARSGAIAFVINEKAYVGLGITTDYAYDLIMFDPTTGKWEKKRATKDSTPESFDNDYTSIVRSNATCFNAKLPSGEERVYLVGGFWGNNVNTNCWEYNPNEDIWSKVNGMPSTSRMQSISFNLDGQAYVGFGGVAKDQGIYSDLWKFIPGIEFNYR